MSNHLTCKKHSRRVMVLPSNKVVHRQNGSACDTPRVQIGGNSFTPAQVTNGDHQLYHLTIMIDNGPD